MKKILVVACLALSLVSLTGCMGVRGRDGNGRVCENEYFLGISIIEQISPCTK